MSNVEGNDLLLFAKWIKQNFVLGIYYGGMLSSEFSECNPTAEYLVKKYLKDRKEKP